MAIIIASGTIAMPAIMAILPDWTRAFLEDRDGKRGNIRT
jgi:hypothetical protein